MSIIGITLIGLVTGVFLVLLTLLAVVFYTSSRFKRPHQSYDPNNYWNFVRPKKRKRTSHQNGEVSSDVPADVQAYITLCSQSQDRPM